jgi:hypothetical protein
MNDDSPTWLPRRELVVDDCIRRPATGAVPPAGAAEPAALAGPPELVLVGRLHVLRHVPGGAGGGMGGGSCGGEGGSAGGGVGGGAGGGAITVGSETPSCVVGAGGCETTGTPSVEKECFWQMISLR